MTRDDILSIAREAGFVLSSNATGEAMGRFDRFAALVAAAERKSRQAAQLENERLKERLARSGVEQRRAVREAVLKEREACAKECEDLARIYQEGNPYSAAWEWAECAAAIRARGTHAQNPL